MTIPGYPRLSKRHTQWLSTLYPRRTWTWENWHASLVSQNYATPSTVTLSTLSTIHTVTNTHMSQGSQALYDFEQRTELGRLATTTHVPWSLLNDMTRLIITRRIDLWSPRALDEHWDTHGNGAELVALDGAARALRSLAENAVQPADFDSRVFPGQVTTKAEYKQLLRSVLQFTQLPTLRGQLLYGLRSPYPPMTTALSLNIIVPRQLQADAGMTAPEPVIAGIILTGNDQVRCGARNASIPKILQSFAGGTVHPLMGVDEDNFFQGGIASRIVFY